MAYHHFVCSVFISELLDEKLFYVRRSNADPLNVSLINLVTL